MKKMFIVYGILVAAVIAIAFFRLADINLFGSNSENIIINDKTYQLMIANDDKTRQVGLSDRENLADNEGMLFVFDQKDRYQFWMKNMNFPIDIVYVDDNTVVDIIHDAQPAAENETNPKVYTPAKAANYVLELKAGQAKAAGLEVGDTIELPSI